MLARNILAVAAAGGVALGALTGVALHPVMKMVPLRPWQGSGQTVNIGDFGGDGSGQVASYTPLDTAMPGWAAVQQQPVPIAVALPTDAARMPRELSQSRHHDDGDSGYAGQAAQAEVRAGEAVPDEQDISEVEPQGAPWGLASDTAPQGDAGKY